MKKLCLFLILSMIPSVVMAGVAEKLDPKQVSWPFEGMFGTFDRASTQRGFQVYKEVCASCHGLRLLSYRNLGDIGFSKAEVKAIAAEYTVVDGPDDSGDMFDRPGRPSDFFVTPFPNQKAARAANGGAFPPDLSLMVKARPDGANYLYSLLTGYKDAPSNFELSSGMHYNPYFSGGQIAMAAPLSEGLVDYTDGTVATVENMSRDIVNFLQWAAEPEMEERKQMGLKVMSFLVVFTLLFYAAKCRIWNRLNHREEG